VGSTGAVCGGGITRNNRLKITISKENYLKAIAEAEAEGETVIAATLARWLNVSPPAVTMALRRLKRDDCIRVSKEGHIELTPEGRTIADRLLHRHHLIERMLTEVFGMSWYKVHDEAEQLEHAVSGEFERLLEAKLGQEESCPHGNQPGLEAPAERRRRGWLPLFESEPGLAVQFMSVFERDIRLLEYLDGLGLAPGKRFEIVSRNYDDTMSLRVNQVVVQIGRPAAEKVWVLSQRDSAGGEGK
jgi:DtxR family transcriptional regulator, Mn-dependent transcriptional regulator